MYLKKISAKKSTIDGYGVFADEFIEKNSIVWKFDENHDKTMSREQYEALNQSKKTALSRIAYLSSTSDLYVYPPENDPALFTNHSNDQFNLSVIIDEEISGEPFFTSNRDIQIGEELLNNYHQFDEAMMTQKVKPDFLK